MSSSWSCAPLTTTSVVSCGSTRTATRTWPRGLASTWTRDAVQVPSASTMCSAWLSMASRVTVMAPPSTVATWTVRVLRAKSPWNSMTTRPMAVTAKHACSAYQ